MGRLIHPEERATIIVAASHAVLTGAPRGLENRERMQSVIGQLSDAEGVMVAPGAVQAVESTFVGRVRPSLVIHLDWKSHGRGILTPGDGVVGEGTTAQLASIDAVSAAGADAVMTYLYVGQHDNDLERREIERNSQIAEQCAQRGIALIIEPRWVGDHKPDAALPDPGLYRWYCRMSAEVGADIVKCVWPGSLSAFADVVAETPVPVLLAGGPGDDGDAHETLALASDVVAAGGAGLMFGRRIYGSQSPAAMLAAMRLVLDQGVSVDDAVAAFERERDAG